MTEKRKKKKTKYKTVSFAHQLTKCAFGLGLKIKIISLFSLFLLLFSIFLLLFMGPIALSDTIHEPHCIISTKFYLLSTVLSKIIFQFQQNKRYPSTP